MQPCSLLLTVNKNRYGLPHEAAMNLTIALAFRPGIKAKSSEWL